MTDAGGATDARAIAIVGVAGRFPGAPDLDAFWRNLRDARESIRRFTDEELLGAGVSASALADPFYVKAHGLLDDIDLFDAGFFGMTPLEAQITDPQHRLFLESAWQALEDAGYDSARVEGRIGVFAGAGFSTYLVHNLLRCRGLETRVGTVQLSIGNNKDNVPTRVSYKLNLKGPSVSVNTACSSSLVAVHLACQSLLDYQCDMVLAGGVGIQVPQNVGYVYHAGGIASPDGHCRPFDARAEGTVSGNGVGIVVLKRLEEALADGDSIRAVILGSAVNNDGSAKVGYTAPSVDGQAEVIAEAQAVAGVDPASIQYVEAHGTGTAVGDPIEIAALTQAFRLKTARGRFCAIGSVKSNIGHLDEAAGAAGLIKTVFALQRAEIPPSLHYERANPSIDFSTTPFFVNASLREWKAEGPRRAGVSSFGIGGTNAHVVLEEAPPVPAPATPGSPWQLLTLAAKTAGALDPMSRSLAAVLRRSPETPLADVAWTLQQGRRPFEYRRAVVCSDAETGAAKLLEPARAPAAAGTPRIVFLFPGQGAQYAGMGAGLYGSEPVFREIFDGCAEFVRKRLGIDIGRSVHGSATTEELRRTLVAQPAVFAVEYALAQLWIGWGLEPHAMLGHSLGEYVAATIAGVFSLEDALEAICRRAELMDALPGGAMLSVPLGEAELAPLLPSELSIAAINAPGRSVVAGDEGAVGRFEAQMRELALDCRRLETSHAFHSRAMDPIVHEFTRCMGRLALRPPVRSWISNVTGQPISPSDATDPQYWGRHMRETVRFSAGATALLRDPSAVFLEIGPGRTLTMLMRRQAGCGPDRVTVSSLRHPDEAAEDGARLLESLGRLWCCGATPDWRAVHRLEARRRVPLPTYPFERQRYWIEPDADTDATVRLKADTAYGLKADTTFDREKRTDVSSWFYLPSWKRTLPPRPDTRAIDRRTLVVSGAGIGRALADALRRNGRCDVSATDAVSWRDWMAASDSLDPIRIIDCSTLGASATAPDRAPFTHVFDVCRAIAQRGGDVELVVITDGAEDVSGSEPLDPRKALMAGPLMVLPQEHPGVHTRLVDVTGWEARGQAALVGGLDAEILGGTERFVAWRDGRRLVRVFEAAPIDEPALPARLQDEGVYLITGGLGGVGLILAEYLAERFHAKLALVGRSAADVETALVHGRGPAIERPAGDSVDAAVARAEDELKIRGLDAFPGLEAAINHLCACYIVELLAGAGVDTRPGASCGRAEFARRLEVTPALEPMCGYFAHVLIEDGLVSRDGERLTFAHSVADLPRAVDLHRQLNDDHPQFAGMLDLLAHCAGHYRAALSGRVPAIGVLYPAAQPRLLEEASVRTVAHTRRDVYTRAVRDLIAERASHAGRRLRILEIGVGDGLLAGVVAPALKGLDVEYHATDLGRTFIDRAKDAASRAGWSFARFGRLDITKSPEGQGYPPGSFDVVLALDVLHATPDVRATVRHVRELVAPDGIAAVIETVHAPRWTDMIWGLAEGWWSFQDAERQQHSPLMPLDRWQRVFEAGGFAQVDTWGRGDYGLIVASAETAAKGEPRLRRQLEAVRRLRRHGSDVALLAADVTDEPAMRAAVAATLERFGRIDGVIHAAGETRRELVFTSIDATGAADIEAVFGPKVTGTDVLARVLAGVPAEFVLLMSSNASVLGGLGLSAYAAASRYLDAFAAARFHDGDRRWISTNWDGWPTEQSAGAGLRFQTSIDRYSMTLAESRSAFVRVLSADTPQIVVSAGDLDGRLQQWQGRRKSPGDETVSSAPSAFAHERPELTTAFDLPETETERVLGEIWSELLGIRAVGVNDAFAELGGDSLLGTQLIARVETAFGCRMPFRSLFEEPTVRLQAAHIDGLLASARPATGEIARLPDRDSYALSDAQRRLWVLSQLDDTAAFNIPLHQIIDGPLDISAFERAFTRLIERHETLRTRIVVIDGEPRQQVSKAQPFHLAVVDLTNDPDPEAAARTAADRAAATAFDLGTAPLFDVSLLRLGADRHAMLFTIHHIVCDGVSVAILSRDLAELYRAAVMRDAPRLPALAIQYRDFAEWQSRLLASGRLDEHRAYWLNALGDDRPVVDLPADFRRPEAQSFRGRELTWQLPPETARAVSDAARGARVSLFMLLAATVKVLLHRYTGAQDVIIGTPTAGRATPEVADQVGCFLNTLALRDRIDPAMPFGGFLDQVRRTDSDAYDHQAYPFDRLVNELNVSRERGRSPIFDVIVILQNQRESQLDLAGLQTRPFFDHNGTSKNDLTFSFKESDAGLACAIEYSTDLFTDTRIERMGRHFVRLLERLVADPAQPIGSVDFLSETERRRLASFNDDRVAPFPHDRTLPDLFAASVHATPDAVAITFGESSVTYAALYERSRRIAAVLRRSGIARGDRVGVYLERSPDMVAALLGIQMAGAAYVPLDPAFPAERLRMMGEDAALGAVLIDPRLPVLESPAPAISVAAEIDRQPPGDEPVDGPAPGDLAYVIFTSGSTGRPKGVAIEQRSLVNELWSMRREPGFEPHDVMLAVTTLSFDPSAVELFLPLICGGRVVLATREQKATGAKLIALLQQSRATVMGATPTSWQMMLEEGWTGDAKLRILTGGEALPHELAARLVAATSRVWNVYGPTETTVWASAFDVTTFLRERAASAATSRAEVTIPVGRPVANLQFFVLDPASQLLPIGVPGELFIGGEGVARGYFNRPELTAERFLPNPFAPDGGRTIYRTGDRVVWREDGALEYLGRLDDQIKLRGFRIEIGEIENTLLQHRVVGQTAVVVAPSPTGPRLQAAVVRRGGHAPSDTETMGEELRRHLRRSLPEYMVPAVFLALDEMPRTPSGKIDRKSLRTMQAPASTAGGPLRSASPLEMQLCRLWQDVLNVETVGVDANFFDLGGHSLTAARLLFKIEKQLGVRLGLAEMFGSPTVAALATVIGQRQADPAAALAAEPNAAGIAPITAEELELLNE